MRHRWWVVLGLVVLLLSAAACGGDDGGEAGDVAVTATDFEFNPDSWTVKAGEPFDVAIINQGSVEHEWVVLNTRIADEGDFTEDLVIWEIEADAGASQIGTAPGLDAGEYQIVCVIPGHFAAGMEGTLRAVE